MIKYNIYPTLLDSFDYYRKSDYSSDKEFFDKINRVQKPKSDAQIIEIEFDKIMCDKNKMSELYESKSDLIICDQLIKYDVYCEFIKEFYMSSVNQIYTECVIPTMYGDVKIYGFIDKIKHDTAYDIKTTKRYDIPKYLGNWQHKVYLECLKRSGYYIDIFTYMITDFKNVFKETYVYDESYLHDTQEICSRFIEFLEYNRDKITDKKIFNL